MTKKHETTFQKQDSKSKKMVSAESSETKELALAAARKEKKIMAKSAVYHLDNAAAVVDAYAVINGGNVEFPDLVEALKEICATAICGDLSGMEAMLISQSVALQTIFTNLARRASKQESMSHYQTFLTLALKAQAQSRSTIQALVELKYPRQVTFVKQSNIANGPQQINNGEALPERTESRTEEFQHPKNKLSPQIEDTRHERKPLDFGTTTKASRTDSELVPVAAVHRTKDRSR
ncbi:MAG: hypothetical protein V1844_13110 [Pseudomonadota bacterium]